MENITVQTGNLTRDPELRFTSGGRAVASFGLAVNRRYQTNGETHEQTSFFDVIAWGGLANNAAQSLGKGDRVVVHGRLEQRSWDADDGSKRYKIEIIASEIAPSLRWATASLERVSRTSSGDDGSDVEPAGETWPAPSGPSSSEEPF